MNTTNQIPAPKTRRSHKWIWLIASPFIAVFVLVVGVGVFEGVGVIPSIEVQQGSDVPRSQKAKLVSEGIIREDEEILYFYSEGFLSVMGGGNILTEDKVISYAKDEEGKLQINSINLDDVRAIELIEEGHDLSDSIYRVSSGDRGHWIEVWLSIENDGHLKFIDALEERTLDRRSNN